MLTDAALEGKIDRLAGLKENVIIGKLIPAATGLKRYRTIEIEPAEPLPRGIDDVGLLEGDDLAAELGLDDGEGLQGFGPAFDTAELEEIGSGFGAPPEAASTTSATSATSAGGSDDDKHDARALDAPGAAAAAAALGVWSALDRAAPPRRCGARSCVLPRWPAALDGLRVAVLTDLHAGMPHAGLDAVERAARGAGRRAARPRLPARATSSTGGRCSRGRSTRRRWRRGWRRCGGAARRVRRARQPRLVRRRAADRRRARATPGSPVLEDSARAGRRRAVGRRGGRLPDPRRARRSRAAARVPDDAPVLLLSHDPDVFPRVPARVALTLAGHTHGGQVAIPLPAAAVRALALRRALRARPHRRGRPAPLRLLGRRHERAAGALPAPARGRQPDAARAQLSSVVDVLVGDPDRGVGRDEQRRPGRSAAQRSQVSSWASSIHATGRSRAGVGLDRRELPVRPRRARRRRSGAPSRAGRPEQPREVLVGAVLPARAPDALEGGAQARQPGSRAGRDQCGMPSTTSKRPREVRFDRSRKGR